MTGFTAAKEGQQIARQVNDLSSGGTKWRKIQERDLNLKWIQGSQSWSGNEKKVSKKRKFKTTCCCPLHFPIFCPLKKISKIQIHFLGHNNKCIYSNATFFSRKFILCHKMFHFKNWNQVSKVSKSNIRHRRICIPIEFALITHFRGNLSICIPIYNYNPRTRTGY